MIQSLKTAMDARDRQLRAQLPLIIDQRIVDSSQRRRL
jgi:hypothetical protein